MFSRSGKEIGVIITGDKGGLHAILQANFRVRSTNVAVRLERQSYQEAAGEFYRDCAAFHDHQYILLLADR